VWVYVLLVLHGGGWEGEEEKEGTKKNDEYLNILFFQQKYSHFTLYSKLPTSVLQATQVVKLISV